MDLYIFSTSGLSNLSVGEPVPDFSQAYPEYFSDNFSPMVKERLPAKANNIRVYKGDRFLHNVSEEGAVACGAVVRLTGYPKSRMQKWLKSLDKLEAGFGMIREERSFERLDGVDGSRIEANIYFLPDLDSIGDKDGELVPLD